MIQRFPCADWSHRVSPIKQPRLTLARSAEVFRWSGPSTVIRLPGAEEDNIASPWR